MRMLSHTANRRLAADSRVSDWTGSFYRRATGA
jgi:hypothetical protein